MGNTVTSEVPVLEYSSDTDSTSSKESRPKPQRGHHRRTSSFLEEPITTKATERGQAPMPFPGGRENGSRRESTKNKIFRFAVSEMQGWRSHMEDMHILCPPLDTSSAKKLEGHYLFAVFDGHGGSFTSAYAGENFVRALTSQPDWKAYLRLSRTQDSTSIREKRDEGNGTSRGDVIGLQHLKKALTAAFIDLDTSIMEAQRNRRLDQLNELENGSRFDSVFEHKLPHSGEGGKEMAENFSRAQALKVPNHVQLERSGSTGVVVLITPTHIICANAGDSRAILTRSGLALPLSFDHKPNNDVEMSRVDKCGGFVKAGRVDGDLAVSRSFGDFAFKSEMCKDARNQRVTVYPDIIIHPRDYANDEFIVLACDGVWDRLSNRDCASLVKNLINEGESDIGLVCEEIIDTCLELDSRDNMTCAVAVFPGAKMPSTVPSSRPAESVGVLKRRADRAKEWGADSTPSKRALDRLKEKKKKHKELIQRRQKAAQKAQRSQSKVSVKSNDDDSSSCSSAKKTTRREARVGRCEVSCQ